MTKNQSNYIKLIAIISMFLDHLGLIFYPDINIFRILGRIAFPLFAYQLTISYDYTKNIQKYKNKLLLLGILFQIPYLIATYFFPKELGFDNFLMNIFFVLYFGLLCIGYIKNKRYFNLIVLFLLVVLAPILKIEFDYGLYGIILIIIFYYYKRYPKILVVLFFILNIVNFYFDKDYIQLYSILSIIFILKPLSLKFNIPKNFFYWFYPVHLVILFIIKNSLPNK